MFINMIGANHCNGGFIDWIFTNRTILVLTENNFSDPCPTCFSVTWKWLMLKGCLLIRLDFSFQSACSTIHDCLTKHLNNCYPLRDHAQSSISKKEGNIWFGRRGGQWPSSYFFKCLKDIDFDSSRVSFLRREGGSRINQSNVSSFF